MFSDPLEGVLNMAKMAQGMNDVEGYIELGGIRKIVV